jgi:hypothetical protein
MAHLTKDPHDYHTALQYLSNSVGVFLAEDMLNRAQEWPNETATENLGAGLCDIGVTYDPAIDRFRIALVKKGAA